MPYRRFIRLVREHLSSAYDPQWHRKAVGGHWEEIGKLQLDFLVREGLKPGHTLLDVGCGALRAGVHLIKYLGEANYVGVDASMRLLQAARRIELPQHGIDPSRVQLYCIPNFDFSALSCRFDFVIAHSLFTHLSQPEVIRCLDASRELLQPGARIYATFFLVPAAQSAQSFLHVPGDIVTQPDRDPFHYSLKAVEEIAARCHLRCELCPEWIHPKGQQMFRFQPLAASAASEA